MSAAKPADDEGSALQLQQLYRSSKLLDALTEALRPLVEEDRITASMAIKVMEHYDASMREAMSKRAQSKLHLRGEVKKYNNVQNVWVYHVKNVQARIEVNGVTDPLTDAARYYDLEIPKLKITSVDEKLLATGN